MFGGGGRSLIGRLSAQAFTSLNRYAVRLVVIGGLALGLGMLIGGALGLIFPMCECGIVVVMRRLLKKGLPLSCCVAYMLAGPILNPIVLGSTAVAFFPHGQEVGWTVLIGRAGLGYLVACITGLVVHYAATKWGTGALLTAPTLVSVTFVTLSLLNKPVTV